MSPASSALTVYKIETPVLFFPSKRAAGTGIALCIQVVRMDEC